MKKKLLFTLIMLVAASSVAMRAQDEPMEYTSEPQICYYPANDISMLSIENTDADENVSIFYRIRLIDEDFSDWTLYLQPLIFPFQYSGYYALYQIECYAVAEGKYASEIVFMEFEVYNELTGNHYLQYYDFYIDGIYYKYRSDSTVEVSAEAIDPSFIGVWSATPFDTYPSYSGNVVIPPTVEYEGCVYQVVATNYFAFFCCSDLLSVELPNTISELSGFACSSVKNIVLPGSITTIGERAFEGSKLTSIVIPNSVTSIGDAAFYYCHKLKSVTIGNSVTTIGYHAFDGCSDLTSVTIGNSVTSIDIGAFWFCSDLASIICKAMSPPTAFENSFWDTYDKATLFVPAESLDAYRNHEEWGKFTHIVPFHGAGPGDINGDGNIAISDATSLIDMLLNGDELPEWADVNGDGVVTIKDVTDLIDMLLGGN